MNSYQRVIHAIQHEPGLPAAQGELVIEREFARAFIDWRVQDKVADTLSDTDLLIGCCRLLKLDLVCLPADASAVHDSILSAPTEDIRRFIDEGLFVFWLVDGAFQRAIADLGLMALMQDIAQSSAEAVRQLQQRSLKVMAAMARGVGAGAHGIIVADDIAYQKRTYMSPSFIEHHLVPIWQAQVAAAHGLGVPVFFHSDGNLNAVLAHIVEAGFDGLQGIEPAAGMDIGAIGAQYGRRICLMGNIDPALLCTPADPIGHDTGVEVLRQAVSEVMAAGGGRGGLVFGTCCGLHAGMRPARVYDMYRLAAECDPVAPPLDT